MAQLNPLKTFRLIAPEFAKAKDSEVRAMLELCEPLVSKKRFGRVYNQVIALLAAHRLKLAGKGENPLGAGGSSTVVNANWKMSFFAGMGCHFLAVSMRWVCSLDYPLLVGLKPVKS